MNQPSPMRRSCGRRSGLTLQGLIGSRWIERSDSWCRARLTRPFASGIWRPDYRPELVAAAFAGETRKLDAALAQIGDLREVLAGLPPKLHLTSPTNVSTKQSEYILSFTLEDRDGEFARIEYRINGVVIAPPTGRVTTVPGPIGQLLYRQPLPLRAGINRLEVRSISTTGVRSEPVVAAVSYSQ